MDVDRILRTAVAIEVEGYDFYAKSAERITDENGRGTLGFLAGEEGRHRIFFESLLEKHGHGERGLLRALLVPRIFPKPRKFEGNGATSADVEILEHAKEAEKKSIDFYSGALKGTKDESLQIGLGIIIGEEKQHLAWIEYLLDGVKKEGFWSSLHGHFSLDGG